MMKCRMSDTQEQPKATVSSRAVAADRIGVNEGYVWKAKRIKEADQELYEDVRAGRVTIPQALRQLDGISDDPRTIHTKQASQEATKILRDPDQQIRRGPV